MTTYLLDTDILSYVLEKNDSVISKLKIVLKENAEILICPVVFYELMRGLHHHNMLRQIKFLKTLIGFHTWCEFNVKTWGKGAELWAELRKKGNPTGKDFDADVLIAAQAFEHKAVVVTHNNKHFEYLEVSCEDWAI